MPRSLFFSLISNAGATVGVLLCVRAASHSCSFVLVGLTLFDAAGRWRELCRWSHRPRAHGRSLFSLQAPAGRLLARASHVECCSSCH